ncbi:MAG: hypothetical protein KAR47_20055, partial [Planctomycetes bacterium]|nr:hypothetical protein [Planctomycetota bacterium]
DESDAVLRHGPFGPLSTARWYGTKMFPLVFALMALCISFMDLTLVQCVVVVVVGHVIFLPQIIHSFLSREF